MAIHLSGVWRWLRPYGCRVVACGRANKYKILPSDARKRLVAAIDFSGRRVTVRDVASKDNFKSNQTQKALANKVWNGDFHKNLVLSIKTQSLFEKGKVAQLFC
ncbi:hypothetical protein CASFOL_030993 [Castilleja foliolosa]|uniref:Uncharacterized protein n=1 Tax=Castilleja foliolosa TaxID=1961234 RepID=A0ABD3C8A1_9LAMI